MVSRIAVSLSAEVILDPVFVDELRGKLQEAFFKSGIYGDHILFDHVILFRFLLYGLRRGLVIVTTSCKIN